MPTPEPETCLVPACLPATVFFAPDDAVLVASSQALLDRVGRILGDNPDVRITVEGHTDSTGTAVRNELLGLDRARAVRDYLAASGVRTSRISIRNFGESAPDPLGLIANSPTRNHRVVVRQDPGLALDSAPGTAVGAPDPPARDDAPRRRWFRELWSWMLRSLETLFRLALQKVGVK